MPTDIIEEYMFADQASVYLKTTERKISLYRRQGLLRFSKLGKNYIYRKEWLDDFMEAWAGYDLSNEKQIALAIKSKEWRQKNERRCQR